MAFERKDCSDEEFVGLDYVESASNFGREQASAGNLHSDFQDCICMDFFVHIPAVDKAEFVAVDISILVADTEADPLLSLLTMWLQFTYLTEV